MPPENEQLQKARVEKSYLPTPLVQQEESTSAEGKNDSRSSPPPSQLHHHTSSNQGPSQHLSSPGDTQALSQFVYPPRAFADEVENEAAEGVWGYLLPLSDNVQETMVLKKRDEGLDKRDEGGNRPQSHGRSPGYLVGRHSECGKWACVYVFRFIIVKTCQQSIDMVMDIPTISNRHFLVFAEVKKGDTIAVLEDISSNGTFINDALVGRNKCRELEDGDEISILDQARFVFRYPRTRETNGFHHEYRILEQLGKGHFATVYLCVERSSGSQYAVKVFEKRQGDSQKTPTESLRPEVALLKAINHPNLLSLKETFDENDGVYLVSELAPEGELFNLIVNKSYLSEKECRHIFVQLFEGLKYLVSVPFEIRLFGISTNDELSA